MELETADLSDLLEGFIAKPVKDELAAHLEEVENCFERQRKRFAAQITETQDLTTSEAKRLRSKLDAITTRLDQLTGQAADDVAVDRNLALRHLEMLQDQFATVLDSMAILTGEQQTLRGEVRLAAETGVAQQVSRTEREEAARRRQTRILAILAPGAGLLGAGAVELLHLFV